MNLKKLFTLFLFILHGNVLVAQSKRQNATVIPGIVSDTVWCDRNVNQSYSIYLPKKYYADTHWPVVFFYEPGARGRLPVTLYSAVAEKYQCILIGSNNSRNGSFTVAEQAEEAVLHDVQKRFSIAEDRIFIAGFSGGARASVHLSIRRKMYAGIIACGAAFPVSEKLMRTDSIPFIELIGIVDPNLIEALETQDYLKKIDYPHALFLFQGEHDWPPVNVFDQAIFWQFSKLNETGKYIFPDSIIHLNEKNILAITEQELDSGDVYMAYLNLLESQALHAKQTTATDSVQKSLSTNAVKKNQEKEFFKLIQTEVELKKQFDARFILLTGALHDSVYKEEEWRKFIAVENKVSKSHNRLQAQMATRVLHYMRMTCVEEYYAQREYHDYFHATLTVRLLTLVENNYWSYFILARTYAARGMKKETLQALSKSASLGMKDKTLIEGNKDFSMLANEKKYSEIMRKVEQNSKAN